MKKLFYPAIVPGVLFANVAVHMYSGNVHAVVGWACAFFLALAGAYQMRAIRSLKDTAISLTETCTQAERNTAELLDQIARYQNLVAEYKAMLKK